MHHQPQRCAGYSLLHSTFPELALFRIFACIQHQIPVGFFASLADTDWYYLPLFFYPNRGYIILPTVRIHVSHTQRRERPGREQKDLRFNTFVVKLDSFGVTQGVLADARDPGDW